MFCFADFLKKISHWWEDWEGTKCLPDSRGSTNCPLLPAKWQFAEAKALSRGHHVCTFFQN